VFVSNPRGGPQAAQSRGDGDPTRPVFYYDLGDPECYLAAERIMSVMPVEPEWEPVLAASVLGAPRFQVDQSELARRMLALRLQPLRWPPGWPPDTRLATLTATYAKGGGRAVAFSLAAFRQAFAGGRDLAAQDTVLIAAAACEMHPTAVLKGIALRSVDSALDRACARARSAGVVELPAIEAGGQLFSGPDAVEAAAELLGAR